MDTSTSFAVGLMRKSLQDNGRFKTLSRKFGACTKSPRSLTAPLSKTILDYLGRSYK
jgi:hypothetical protein